MEGPYIVRGGLWGTIVGLNVSPTCVVSVSDEHERFLNTAEGGTCYVTRAGSEFVVNVFRRRQDDGRFNDGIPLMYALKGTKGFTVAPRSLVLLRRRALDRLARHFADSLVDVIIPAPSSSDLPVCLARTLAPALGGDAQVVEALRKPTIGSVLAGRADLDQVRGPDLKFYKQALGIMRKLRSDLPFSVKGIHTRARPYFRTVELGTSHGLAPGMHVLVVDDSCSSGTTLRDAITVLRTACRPASIRGVALVGPS